MVTLDRGVVGLARHHGCSIGLEGAVGGSRARWESFGAEFWNGVVADQDTRLVLQTLSEMRQATSISLRGAYFWFTHRLIAWDVRADLAWLVADSIRVA